MLRKLREQWWYVFLWLPTCTFIGFLAVWLWVVFHVIAGWTVRGEEAPKWGFLSACVVVLLVLYFTLLLPRKSARRLDVALASVGFIALLLGLLFYANTREVFYQVSDADGGPLEGIPIHITHHANGVALTWLPGEALLRTDKEGKATIRIFKSEQCDANVNDLLGQQPGFGNAGFSEDNAFFIPIRATVGDAEWPLGKYGLVEHSYMLEGPSDVSQRCLESPLDTDSGIIPIYLRRLDSTSLPPYFDQIVKTNSTDPAVQRARMMSLGGSIESFNHLDELLSAVARDDSLQASALFSASFLATQIKAIYDNLPTLSAANNTHQSRGMTKDQREACSQAFYVWLSGENPPPPLSHLDRLAYIRQRMDDATRRLIDALHPAMLKNKLAYAVLNELRELARPAMKFYPEVFAKGTPEAREGALGAITFIAPPADDVAFLIRSKKPDWIERVINLAMNSGTDDLSNDLKTLKALRAQEKDAENIIAFDRVINAASDELMRHQAYEADKPLSDVIPRYPVIDLGINLLQPIKITNSGYVLGRNNATYYVWFDGKEIELQPKTAGDVLTVEDLDESGTAVGTEMDPVRPGGTHRSINRATWEKGATTPQLTPASLAQLGVRKAVPRDLARALDLPQLANAPVTPVSVNAAMALLPAQEGPPAQPAQLVMATEVIGNGAGGGYVWEMTPTLSTSKTFEGPTPINDLLPGEPKVSPWKVTSVASINDGGTIVGTAIYTPSGPNDPMAAGPRGVMLMPLAIVRESPPGSGNYGPITDNGLDDNASIPVFASAPPRTPANEKSNPESDGQGIFYVQMPGSIAATITLRSGSNTVTVPVTSVNGRPNVLRTGKLVLIAPGDPFRAPDITTLEVGGNSVELQKYGRTIVR